MIKVVVKKATEHFKSITISGHANAAVHGEDIVCAAVSVLGQTLGNALEVLAGLSEQALQLKYKDGFQSLEIPEDADQQIVTILIKNFIIGIEGIVGGYPKYVKLIIEEVQGDDESF